MQILSIHKQSLCCRAQYCGRNEHGHNNVTARGPVGTGADCDNKSLVSSHEEGVGHMTAGSDEFKTALEAVFTLFNDRNGGGDV